MKKTTESELKEPLAVYEVKPKQSVSISQKDGTSNPENDALYMKLKAEADKIYGQKKRMTVEEYFGKLRYIVNGYYESLQCNN